MKATRLSVLAVSALAVVSLGSCSHTSVALKDAIGQGNVEIRYLRSDGTWVPGDSVRWTDRTTYRELRFDTDHDGSWNYLYGEVYDDVAGWVWLPWTARINPEEEPDLAKTKAYLTREQETPADHPGVDDFGYGRK